MVDNFGYWAVVVFVLVVFVVGLIVIRYLFDYYGYDPPPYEPNDRITFETLQFKDYSTDGEPGFEIDELDYCPPDEGWSNPTVGDPIAIPIDARYEVPITVSLTYDPASETITRELIRSDQIGLTGKTPSDFTQLNQPVRNMPRRPTSRSFEPLFGNSGEPMVSILPPLPQSIRTADSSGTKPKLVMESQCRSILENYFGKPFPSTRKLPWLKNPLTGMPLEIDCYNNQLKIGLEYNGYQHYHYPNHFHKTEDEFHKQLARDKVKTRLCREYGVHLISVPYHVEKAELEKYIISRIPRKYKN